MLPGVAGFLGAHRRGLEELGLVQPCPAVVLVPLTGHSEAGLGV